MTSPFDARVVALDQTCGACPSQWEGRLDNGQRIYVRYRWGRLQLGVGPNIDAAVDATIKPGDDNYAEKQIGHSLDGVLTFGELVDAARDLVPALDFSGGEVELT